MAWSGVVEELGSTATFLARYPLGLTAPPLTTGHGSEEPDHDTPVLLVHGYGHNQSGLWTLDRYLRSRGHTSVHRMNYMPVGVGIPALAEQLAAHVDEIRTLTGSAKVHVVGHSLGGILLRWYVQELGGDDVVGTAVTLASPHAGTLAALLAPEKTVRQLRPGSWVMNRLAAGARPSPVRWVAFWSDGDMLVLPHRSAQLTSPALGATNVMVRELGHLSVLLSSRICHEISEALVAA